VHPSSTHPVLHALFWTSAIVAWLVTVP